MIKFYTTFEAARLCHVSPGSVVRWIHEGKIKASTTGGGHHRISAENLARFLRLLEMPIPEELISSPLRILIVDDEDSIRQLIKAVLLKAFPHCILEEAEDGFTAGWKSHQIRPDIVLLDILLPKLDGIGVCEFIRRHEELKEIRIIAMSGMDLEANKIRVLKAGADDFLGKPFTLETLIKKIRGQLEQIPQPVLEKTGSS